MAKVFEWDAGTVARFSGNLSRLATRFPQAAYETGGQVALQALNDTVMEAPTVPMLTGHLRGTSTHEVHVKAAGAEILYGYNTVYAAVMHEGRWETGPLAGVTIRHWTEPGSGPGFILQKLQRHGREYIEVWADKIRRELGM